MKNLIKLILGIVFISTIFIGCSYKVLPEQKNKEVMIIIKDDGFVSFYPNISGGATYDGQSISFITSIKEAAAYGEFHNFKYFAIKGSSEFDNLKGTPIVTLNSLLSFCTTYENRFSKSNSGDCGDPSYVTNVKFFKEKPTYFPTWSVKDVLIEKIDIQVLKNHKKNDNKYYLKSKENVLKILTKHNIEYID